MRKLIINTLKFALMTGFASWLSACAPHGESSAETRTVETENLLVGLMKIPAQGFMFGHHDDTVYGIGWEGDEGRSDVKSVCGDYPAVISFDLGGLELGKNENLDNVSFEKMRREIINQYQRGGMVTLSWHAFNPSTGGDSWDISDSTVVETILPDGTRNQLFAGWLDKVADFLNSLKTENGVKVPVLFRPWHEHSGSWFWWGANFCTPEEYKALWRTTVDSLRTKGVNNVLYAYSPGTEPQDTTQYLERYPGDDLIDLIGFDTYQLNGREAYLAALDKGLAIVDSIGKVHQKIIALTETGYESIPDSVWWTHTLLPVIEKYPIAYVLVWRNAREKVAHYYAPYPGQASERDFVEFYNHPKSLFAKEVKLYE